MSAKEPTNPGAADELTEAAALDEARVAELELQFLTLLRATVRLLMDSHKVEVVADLPHAHALVRKAVEECALEKGLSYEAAAEIARRDLGFPESDA